MSMVTNNRVILLNNIKPYSCRWKVEVKVLRLWTQHFAGQETFEFVVEDKMDGTEIQCTCKSLFLERVKKLQIGQWRYLENFTLYLNTGIRRKTNHKFKIRITADSMVTKSPVNTYEVHLIDHNIEGSSGDVSTSCSKRKEGDADLNDMNSTSKKLCAKKLIMEKTEEDLLCNFEPLFCLMLAFEFRFFLKKICFVFR
ncbi:hypothetical protein Bca4012_018544 [Brassica carinata]